MAKIKKLLHEGITNINLAACAISKDHEFWVRGFILQSDEMIFSRRKA